MDQLIPHMHHALDHGDMKTAATLAGQAFARGMREALLYNLIAWEQEEAGQFTAAEATLRDGLVHHADDPSLHLALGIVLRHQGKLKAAVDAFEQAIALDAAYAAAWIERGATFERGGAAADAAEDYRRALAIEPDNAAALAGLATIQARLGQHADAEASARKALLFDPDNLPAHVALAQVALEGRRYQDVVDLLAPVARREDDQREALIAVRTLLGDGYQGLGRFDEAYRSFEAAQKQFRAIHTERIEGEWQNPLTRLANIDRAFAKSDKALWKTIEPAAPSPPATHVILTGFPRSGTTLVENILASLPNAVAVEERPTLAEVERRYLNDEDGLTQLAGADPQTLSALRADYWERAERAAGESLNGKLFIDMDPFKGSRLPAIAKLFPHAKIVLMRRDPRDVVWSCFRTNFAFNGGTIGFTSLESTARQYDLAWRIAEAALAELPIDWFELRYDALIGDFDGTTRALCDFLGVEWDPKLRAFADTAQRRGVSTASATQVRRGLYNGSGGWRRYADQLRTVELILTPWIERFGFEPW